jgi:hypothetical protein
MNIIWLVLLFKEFLEVVPNGSTQLKSFCHSMHVMVFGSLNIDLLQPLLQTLFVQLTFK